MNPINIWCVKYLLCFVNCYICKIRRSAVNFLIFPHWFYNFRSPTTFSGRKTPKSGRKMLKTEIWISNHFPIGKSKKNRKPEIFRFRSSPKNGFPTENWSLARPRVGALQVETPATGASHLLFGSQSRLLVSSRWALHCRPGEDRSGRSKLGRVYPACAPTHAASAPAGQRHTCII